LEIKMKNVDLVDLGFAQAGAGDALTSHAQTAIASIVGFPDEVPDEARADLYVGYRKRWDMNHPAKLYAMIDGNYVLATAEMEKNKKIEKVEIGMTQIFGYSQQEFGKLSTAQPALYGVMKPIRAQITDYCSGALADLKSKARKIIKKDNPTPRAPNLDFSDWLMDKEKGIIPEMQAKCKTAKKRGDATADEARLREAIAAFLAKWKP
jgi:hypothetical protein